MLLCTTAVAVLQHEEVFSQAHILLAGWGRRTFSRFQGSHIFTLKISSSIHYVLILHIFVSSSRPAPERFHVITFSRSKISSSIHYLLILHIFVSSSRPAPERFHVHISTLKISSSIHHVLILYVFVSASRPASETKKNHTS